MKYDTESFIQKSELVHGSEYTYENAMYVNYDTKVLVTCAHHGDFLIRASDHWSGRGCRQCANVSRSKTTQEFVEQLTKVFGTKYDYTSTDYVTSKDAVSVICNEHGPFSMLPNPLLRSKGCPFCNGTKRNTLTFTEQSMSVHCNIYDYSNTNYINMKTPVNIICTQHGEFKQYPGNHLRGNGCNKCGDVLISNSLKLSNDYVKELFIEVHGDVYDYTNTQYTTMHATLTIICKKHGTFDKWPADHINGAGCPKCAKSFRKAENKWLDSLQIDTLVRQHKIIFDDGKYVFADGYDPETNTVYEFWGDYWHGNPDVFDNNDVNCNNKKTFGLLYEQTQRKIQKYKEHMYNMVDMWENDFNEHGVQNVTGNRISSI